MSTARTFADLVGAVGAGYIDRDPAFVRRLQYWLDRFGDRPVDTLTRDDVEDGIDALMQRGKLKVTRWQKGIPPTIVNTGKPLAPATINRYVATLGGAFKAMRRLRLLPRGFVNPVHGVGRQGEGEGRTVTVTVEDVRRLVAAARVSSNRKLAALIAMACTTGWRRGTLEALRWQAIDFKAGHADTLRTKNGTPHRTPLLPWVLDELRRMRPALAQPGDLVFGRHNVRRAFQTALKRADLPGEWTFHHCRHIAASILAQSGASVVTIMQALNHKTPLMAMRYSHLNTDALRESLGRAWANG